MIGKTIGIVIVTLASLVEPASDARGQWLTHASQFVEVRSGDWRAFPSPGALLAAHSGGLALRSGDGQRHVRLVVPDGWSITPGCDTSTRFTRIDHAGSWVLRATPALQYTDGSGRTSLSLTVGNEGRLDFVLPRDSAVDWPRIEIVLDPAVDAHAILDSLIPSPVDRAVWQQYGLNRFRLVEPSDTDSGSTVISQSMVFGTYLGGSGGDTIRDMQMRDDATLILAGTTGSLDFPVTVGAADEALGGSFDGFVCALADTGSELAFATFLGGSDEDWIQSMAFADDGTIVVAGGTRSVDLPMTPGAFDDEYGGATEDAFVARLSADGSTLLGATYVGGTGLGVEYAERVRIHPQDGSILIGGRTCSADWPTTPGAFAPESAGDCDVYVTRLTADLSALVASTLFGGELNDSFGDLACLPDGSVVMAGGGSVSIGGGGALPPIPIATEGPFAGVGPPEHTAYLLRFSSDLSTLRWATWVNAGVRRLLTPAGASIVLVGVTDDAGYPVTPSAADNSFDGSREWFVSSLTLDGVSLNWSTFITSGGSSTTGVTDAGFDEGGRIYISGTTTAASIIPFTPDALDTELSGLSEGALIVLASDGSEILYATLVGQGNFFQAPSTAVAPDGCSGAFIAGTTYGSFPVTPGAFDETHNGSLDSWLARITTFSPWVDLGGALPGSNGRPALSVSSPLCAGDPGVLALVDGPDGGAAFVVLGLRELAAPFKAGVLVPTPDVLLGPAPLDGDGTMTLPFTWPGGVPSGLDLWLQAWMQDAAGPQGWSASNGARGTTP